MSFPKTLVLALSLGLSGLAHAADQRLDADNAALVKKVIAKCITGEDNAAEISAQCRGSLELRKLPARSDESGDHYAGTIQARGLDLQLEVTVAAGMDADEDRVVFEDAHGEEIAEYNITRDDLVSPLAVIKALQL